MDRSKAEKMLARARGLADSGRFPNWREVAEQIAIEGYPIQWISKDEALVELLDLRCSDARKAQS